MSEETNKKEYWHFNIFSGEIYSVDEDELYSLDAFQIPLKSKPKNNCNKCFGRFYEGYNITSKHYDLCRRCAKKYIDLAEVIRRKKLTSDNRSSISEKKETD